MTRAEVVLRHDGVRWRAHGDGVECAHVELRELDALIARAHAAHPGGARRVHVRFDLDALPAWLRQYHAHYCNYVLDVGRITATERAP